MKKFFIFSLLFISFISCKNDVDLFSKVPSNKVSIEITGDENVIINTESIEIKNGTKWKNIKRKALKCIQYKKGYVFESIFLDEEELTEDYVFDHDATIYITSKLKRVEKESDIKLNLVPDEYAEIDDAELVIKIGTTWKEIKEDVNARLKFQAGYELSKWKLGKSKKARILNENYVFKRNCTIYALSKEIEENTVTLNLIGDENVILQYPNLSIPFGVVWLEIKDNEYISSVRAKEGYRLSDWKTENNVHGKTISDDYIFDKNTMIYIFAIKDGIDDSLLPDAPKNIEIDELGMVTVIPPVEGIRGEKIDYRLCNYPKEQNEKLWHGVFSEGSAINIAPYKINQYETTYKLWKEVYEWAILHDYVFENVGCRGCSVNDEETNEDEPVTKISYRDCLVWCNAYTEKLNKNTSSCVYLECKDGRVLKNAKEQKNGKNLCDYAYIDFAKKGMRLPKESEWELAARLQLKTKTNAVFCSGIYLTKLNSASGAILPICMPDFVEQNVERMYNELLSTVVCAKFFNGYSFTDFYPKTTKTSRVGSKRANQLGLYDMSGNVGEWCSGLTVDEMFIDSTDNNFAIFRGGFWLASSYKCSVGYRESRYTNFLSGSIGFRVCQTK